MWRVTVTPRAPLVGEVDPDERFERFPRSYTLKGMFFTRILKVLGSSGYSEIEPLLIAAPRGGRYLPFRDYPQVDYSRLCYDAAVRRFPRHSVPEAMRRLARADFEEFANSKVGRVTLALTGDLTSSLMKLPDIYRMSLKGGLVSASRLEDGVRVEFDDFYGWVDCYPIGTVEGIVQHYGFTPSLEVEFLGDQRVGLEVRWA